MIDLFIRRLDPAEASRVLALYLGVAAVPDGGLARQVDEITLAHVESFLSKAKAGGITLGAFDADRLVGEIHAARIGPRQFAHVWSDLTVVVDPAYQGQQVGSRLFQALFDAADALTPPVTRIELVARSGNRGALRLYERLGFVREGCFRGRVRLPDGRTEDDIPMARMRQV